MNSVITYMFQYYSRTFILLSIIIVQLHSVNAQVDSLQLQQPLWMGIGAHAGMLLHSSDGSLRCINDPACPTYSQGSGMSYGLHGIFEWKSATWGIRSGIGLYSNNAEFSVVDDNAFTKDQNGNVVSLVRSHTLSASIPQFTTEFSLQRFFGNAKVFAGGALGYLMSASWTSSSSIVSPGNVSFSSGRRDTTFLRDVSITSLQTLQGFIQLGVGYDIMKNSAFKVTPELVVQLPLSSIVDNAVWKQTAIMAQVSLRWGTGAEKERIFSSQSIIDTIELRDPSIIGNVVVNGLTVKSLTIEENQRSIIEMEYIRRTDTLHIGKLPKEDPKVQFGVFSSNEDDKKIIDEIRVEGQLVTEGFPILSMVFFNAHSAELPDRYNQLRTIEGFSIDSIEPLVTKQHQDILNIIGSRMKARLASTITLEPMSDPKTENGDCALALQRATTIKNYLVNIWNIEPKRILIQEEKKRCSPLHPTMTQNEQGYAENRRVEMSSNDETIFSPVKRTRYLQLTGFAPKELFIDAKGTSSQSFNNWQITSRHGERALFAKQGAGKPDLCSVVLSEDMVRPMQVGDKNDVVISMMIQDDEGNTADKVKTLVVKRDTTNYAIQRLSLMSFGVQQSTLNKQAEHAITTFLGSLEPDATMSIVGYSDNLGNSQTNVQLAQDRANAVSAFIKKIKPQATIVLIDGVGSNKLPPGIQSHDLPESRFLSRTVQIELIRRWKSGD